MGVLALRVVSEVEGLEFELVVMASLEPDNEGVVITLPHQVLVGPLIVSRLKTRIWLHILLQRIGVVAQLHPVIPITTHFS